MNKIRLLDTSTINKIAAGEVIERPFSVVKELVENSIDAGSSKIIVEIRDGGIPFIRITDNGCGIESEDIKSAFVRHATSKISEISDLHSLGTLGFRGEALASIASVSQLEITTKTKDKQFGVRFEIFGGEVLGKSGAACNNGTIIAMRNLFYNTPARKKFLKSVSAEAGYISDFMSKIALSRPDIGFRFINNGKEALFTSGNGDLKTAIFSLYGHDYAEKMMPVDNTAEGITVSGFVGKPELSRANRLSEDIFVNGRYVKDKIISRAAEDAYKTYLMVGKFPAFVLNVEMSAADVDVNAHPQKLEVRFSDEDKIYNAVFNTISETLKSSNLIHRAVWGHEEIPVAAEEKYAPSIAYDNIELKQSFLAKEVERYALDREPIVLDPQPEIFEAPAKGVFSRPFVQKAEQPALIEKTELFSDYRIIGQVFSTYWIVEEGGRLYVIDQHAAHERVLFEKVKAQLAAAETISQTVLVPERLSFSDREKSIALEKISYIRSLGFEMSERDGELYLHSMPMVLSKMENSETLKQVIDLISDGAIKNPELHEIKINSLAVIACKAAVKGNSRMTEIEARTVIESLLKLENPFTCPHGRPTIIEMTKYELETRFKRA